MDTRFFFLCAGLLCGCGSSSNGGANTTTDGTGGNAATGGSVSTGSGGNVLGAGGNVGGGGGAAPLGSGGSYAGAGGSVIAGAGGTVTGGSGGLVGAGGFVGSSGATSSSGATGMSSGGASQGGQTGSVPPSDVSKSAGCGKTAPMAGDLMMDVMGTSREYILALPSNYDPSMPYRLIFAWHGLGGSAQQVASNWYGLKSLSANSAVFVAGQGLMTTTSVGSGAGWPNTNGQDVAFVKALYALLQGELCFDQHRVFSVGMSYGGIMSDTLGCQMGDVFRAIAPMSGMGPGFGGRANCVGQVAVWMSNGDNDTIVPTAQEEASRDFWVGANHCQTQGMPTDPSPCIAYPGCDPGYPVTWCEFMGGHTIPPFAASAIWKFLSQF